MVTAAAFRLGVLGSVLVVSCRVVLEFKPEPTLGEATSAVAPPPPTYSKTFLDSVSGPGPGNPVAVTHPNASCASCYVAPSNPPAGGSVPVDNYVHDVYERPFGRGAAASTYLGGINIVSTDVGLTTDWVYYRINLAGPLTGQSYAFGINYDGDPRGDAFIHAISPLANLGMNTWGVAGLSVVDNQNDTQGGTFPTQAEGPGNGASYEHTQFNSGSNASGVGGADAAQARIVGNSIEFAIKRPFLAVLQGAISKAAFRPYAARTRSRVETSTSTTAAIA